VTEAFVPETTTGATEGFFRDLGLRGFAPSLVRAKGTVRITVTETSHPASWLVTVDRGVVSVSQGDAPQDCEIRGPALLLDAIVRGTTNALAAYLRGELTLEGDLELIALFQRLLPSRVGPDQRAEGRPDG
jgi:ubiquinone biosynthesis protein UbiJ